MKDYLLGKMGLQIDEGMELVFEGYPDAIRCVKVKGNDAQRYADLYLHKLDLQYAHTCLHSNSQ